MATVIVVCADHGQQEPRPVKTRQQFDSRCPLCCSETLPLASGASRLAEHVRQAASTYAAREEAAVARRKGIPEDEDRERIRANYRTLRGGGVRLHIVTG